MILAFVLGIDRRGGAGRMRSRPISRADPYKFVGVLTQLSSPVLSATMADGHTV